MAGPWDNVSLPQPPNGPAYINAGLNAFNTLNNAISGLGTDYQQGQQFQYQQRNQNLFQNGLPTDQSGNIDYTQVFQRMLRQGGSPVAQSILPSLIDLQLQGGNYNALRSLSGGGSGQPTQPTAVSSIMGGGQPNYGNPAPPSARPPLSATGGDTTTAGGETVQTLTAGIASGRGIGDVPQSKIFSFARALNVNPDTPLTAQQESIARKLIGANIGGGNVQGGATPNYGGTNPVSQSGPGDQEAQREAANDLNPSLGPGSPPITPRATAGQGRGQPLKVTVTPTQVAGDGFEDRFNAAYGNPPKTPLGDINKAEALEAKAAEYYAISARPGMKPQQAEAARKMGDQLHEQAKQIRDTLQQYGSPQYNPQLKGQMSRFEGADKAVGEEIGQYRKSLQPARQMVNQLDIIDDAIKSAKGNLTTGPGAEAMLKIKQFVANVTGEPVKGLREAEVIQKMNAYLASEAAKQLTNRPSQLEFKAFMANNPGIMNSIQGTQVLTDILRQTAKQTIGLGQLAGNRSNWDQWGDVESEYFRRNPIRMPFSGSPAGQTQGQTAPGRYQWTPQGGLQRVQ